MNPETRRHLHQGIAGRAAEETSKWLRRADLQIEFARAFIAIQSAERAPEWSVLVDRAAAHLEALDHSGGVLALSGAVKEAESLMAPIGRAAKEFRIHCVGHGHIDMNWMWSWPETVATTHDTFASVLSLMDQYPELTYSQSQASVYELTERYYPHLFEQIQTRVREGRWEVTAAHWVEGEKNLASGESICRHLLYTRDYFQRKFGLKPEDVPVDWEPDTFGHAATVPTILAQGAVKYYYSCRTGGGFEHAVVGDPRPRLFYWQAPDGARVLVNRESTWYNSYVNIGDNIALPMVDFTRETQLHDWLNIYGIGNHGGGPTRKEVDYLMSLREWPIYPEILFSTSTKYFQAVEAEVATAEVQLPILDHELNFEFTGCYTSQSAIKRGNRFGENYLEEAETLAALASRLVGCVYPTESLREAWLKVLFNQFHDILPGSGVRETREHAQALFQEVGAITGAIKRTAGGLIAARVNTLALLPDTPAAREERQLVDAGSVNTPFVAGTGIGAGESGYSQANGGGRRFLPFVVYNPCTWERSERVSVALYDTDLDPARIVALDDSGTAHPALFPTRGSDWGHEKITVAFDATGVPALGYRTFLLCEGAATPSEATVQATAGDWFETPYLRFRVDRFRSGLLDLIDKRTGAVLASPESPIGMWQYITERPRGMTAWALGEEIDAPVRLRSTGFQVLGAARNQGTSAPIGSGTTGYRIESHLEVPGTHSTVRVTMMISALEPRIDFSAEIDWREIGDAKRGIPGLIIRFPFQLSDVEARYEIPFGSVVRDLNNGEEVPALRYAHLAGKAPTAVGSSVSEGVTLLQDCKYGHSLKGSELGLRIVRSSFDPDHAPEVARSSVRYSLTLHDTPATPAALTRLGAAWNHPLLIAPAALQNGTAPTTDGWVRVTSENVVLTAFKMAEDGSGIVIRLAELNGMEGDAEVEIASELAAGLSKATLRDLMERNVEGAVSWDGATLRVPMKPHGLTTVRLR